MEKRLRVEPGRQLWVFHLAPNPAETGKPPDPTPPSLEAMSRINVKESSLVDESGEKHPFLWGRLSAQTKPTDQPGWVTIDTQLELAIYSLPRNREARAIQLGDGSQVPLPQK